MRVTILGCGGSAGVPVIGCDCKVCRSENPKNKRMRVSVLVETGGVNLLLDTSPDLRQQALRHDMRRVDAVLYTHDHADHTQGLDDMRSFNYLADAAIPVYGDAATIGHVQQRFPYAFLPKPEKIWYRPSLSPHILPDAAVHEFNVADISVRSFQQQHGKAKTLGYRIGNFAYSTDTDVLPESAFQALEGVEVWVVDCLRYTASFSHSHVSNTLEWIARVKPKLAILTHMAHDLEYDTLAAELPAGVVPGYDGMVVEL